MLSSLSKAEEMLIKTDANYHPLSLAQLIVQVKKICFCSFPLP